MNKHTLVYCLIILTIGFFSCESKKISFEQPQPEGVRNETSFKKKFLGVYFGIDDSSKLTISKTNIIKQWDMMFKYHKSSFDTITNYKIRRDSIYGAEFEKGVPYKYQRDTISFVLTYTDTLFFLDTVHFLRSLKNYYFLNYKFAEGAWGVKKLGFDKYGYLELCEISEKNEIENLREITQVKEIKSLDSNKIIRYSLNPSKKEFKKFFRNGGFIDVQRFVRIKEND